MPHRPRQLSAFFGHHKCASSWLAMICREACRDLALRSEVIWSDDLVDGDLAGHVEREGLDFLIYTNADHAQASRLPPFRGFHVVRDPRDVCVSAYFSHLDSHPTDAWPELEEHRRQLRSLSKDDGLLLDMDFMADFFDDMRSWPTGVGHVLELKMEELTADPYRQVLAAFEFLDLVEGKDYDAGRRLLHFASKACRRVEHLLGGRLRLPIVPRRLPAERLLGIVWEQDFKKKAGGREPGTEDRGSHYRKGVAGDWRNHFTPRHVEHFKGRYNDLLLRYGYERTESWGESAPRQP